jgi:hypothetical protein
MRAKGVGELVTLRSGKSGVRVTPDSAKEAVRVQRETWKQLAALRRPLTDSEGNLVAFESFDRVVRRLIAERKADSAPRETAREIRP